MKGVLPWLVHWARPALAALICPVQYYFLTAIFLFIGRAGSPVSVSMVVSNSKL